MMMSTGKQKSAELGAAFDKNFPITMKTVLSEMMSINTDASRAIRNAALFVRSVYSSHDTASIKEYNTILDEVILTDPASKKAFLLMLFSYDVDKFERKAVVDPNPIYTIALEKARNLFSQLREEMANAAEPLTPEEKSAMRARWKNTLDKNKDTIMDAAKTVTGLEASLEKRLSQMNSLVISMTEIPQKGLVGKVGLFGTQQPSSQKVAQADRTSGPRSDDTNDYHLK